METLTHISYLTAAVLFIMGLKKLSSPKTARTGNQLAMLGMALAVVVTLLDKQIIDFTYIIVGVVVGTVIGVLWAKKVEMTAMPQMVAVFNGFGGGASALVAFSEYEYWLLHGQPELRVVVSIIASLVIGAVTFTGSIVAFGKLQGLLRGAPIVFRGQKALNVGFLLVLVGLAAVMAGEPLSRPLALGILIIASLIGIFSVIPVGGADMPVVISLLNSYSGLAASATGFVLHNNMLIISGALVGASGVILTQIMCKAMNRSLTNVLFAAVGTESGTLAGSETAERRKVTEYTAEDAVMVLESAQSVIIVPGYGLAVAQAQHALQDMAKLLMDRGTTVRYAIHPVAGRMPGHMNILLAEANVSYDLLCEMEAINDDFQNTDVALVIGANDVINPAARNKKESPLYGMPILNVDKARSVMIIKRSLATGFAGEDNDLFYDARTMMVFGDAKKVVTEFTRLLKSS